MSNEEMINELKKDLVYNPYRDTYVIRGENLPFMAERLVKLFAIPRVIKSVCIAPKGECDRKPEDVCKECEGCKYLEQTVL